jgi:hypothetical protein
MVKTRFLIANYLRKREKLPKVLVSVALVAKKISCPKTMKEKLDNKEKEKAEHEMNISALNFLAFIALFLIILFCNILIWSLVTT